MKGIVHNYVHYYLFFLWFPKNDPLSFLSSSQHWCAKKLNKMTLIGEYPVMNLQ